MGKEREGGNFPPGTWDKLVRVLKSKPFIGGSKDGRDDQTIREDFSLAFPGGFQETLKHEGSVYDYVVLGKERYHAQPTLEQMDALISVHGEPEKVVYEVKGNLDAPSFGPLEIPYQAITDLVAKIKKGER